MNVGVNPTEDLKGLNTKSLIAYLCANKVYVPFLLQKYLTLPHLCNT